MTVPVHCPTFPSEKPGSLEYAKKTIDLYIKEQEETNKWKTKEITYIKYP